MGKSFKTFFAYLLLLVFLCNVSGAGVMVSHSGHTAGMQIKKSDKKSLNHSEVSQDDECQCALHLHMNNSLLEDTYVLNFPKENVYQTKSILNKPFRNHSLLEYFSSRAPPAILETAV